MDEVWKDIDGYEGMYQASTYGRIRSFKPINQHFDKREEPIILKQSTRSSDIRYLCISLIKDGGRTTGTVHRLIANTFIPNPFNKPQVNHIDGDPTNNRVDNLEWVSAKENIDHAIRTGLSDRKGEENGRALLTEEDVINILQDWEDGGYTKTKLGEKYGVHRSQIYKIVNRKQWKHVYDRFFA